MNFSKEIFVSLILTVLFFVIVILQVSGNNSNSNQNQVSSSPTPTPVTNMTKYSINDVAKHNSMNDCWLIIADNVYNATNYLFNHPGGAQMIIPYCGSEATLAFDSIRKHDSRAQAALSSILIGSIK